MKHNYLFNLLILGICLSLSACYYDVESELYPAVLNTGCDTTAVTYITTIEPIITSTCAISGCHVAGAQTPDLSNYTGLKGSIDRVSVRAITEKTMPPSGPLSPCNVLELQAWINRGAVNN
ncbi:MAG: hypothetical protein IPP32_10615 [Bacteroidetes bacterium]|nr:hypothetical protein [Bacteroidota bacterium]